MKPEQQRITIVNDTATSSSRDKIWHMPQGVSDNCEGFGYYLIGAWANPSLEPECIEDGNSLIDCVTQKYCPDRVGNVTKLTGMSFVIPALPTSFPGDSSLMPLHMASGKVPTDFTDTSWFSSLGLGRGIINLINPAISRSNFHSARFTTPISFTNGDVSYTQFTNITVYPDTPGMFPPMTFPVPVGAVNFIHTKVDGIQLGDAHLLKGNLQLLSAVTFYNTSGDINASGEFGDIYIAALGIYGNFQTTHANFKSAGAIFIGNSYSGSTPNAPCTATNISRFTMDQSTARGIIIEEGCGTSDIDYIFFQSSSVSDLSIHPSSISVFNNVASHLTCSDPLTSPGNSTDGVIEITTSTGVSISSSSSLQNCYFTSTKPSTSKNNILELVESTVTGWGTQPTFTGFSGGTIYISQITASSPYAGIPLPLLTDSKPQTLHIEYSELTNLVFSNIIPSVLDVDHVNTLNNVLLINVEPYCNNSTMLAPNGTTVICSPSAFEGKSVISIVEETDTASTAKIPTLSTNVSGLFSARQLLSTTGSLFTATAGLLASGDDMLEQDTAFVGSYPPPTVDWRLAVIVGAAGAAFLIALLYAIYKACTPSAKQQNMDLQVQEPIKLTPFSSFSS